MSEITAFNLYYSNYFTRSVLETTSEVSKVSKEILSIAPSVDTTDTALSTNTDSIFTTLTQNPVAPSVEKNPVISNIVPTAVKPLETESSINLEPAVIPAQSQPINNNIPLINDTTAQTVITPEISRQIATNQAGFGVNLSEQTQKDINSLNVKANTYTPPAKTEDLMNGRMILPEMKTQEELKNIFIVPNIIRTFETLIPTNVDPKRESASSGFSFTRNNNQGKQQKRKNSLDVPA
ncbi:MAG: hypothetical protein WCK67_10670 [bacterium]